MFKHNSLLAFTVKALASLLVLSFTWPVISPYYNRFLVMVGSYLMPSQVDLTVNTGDIYFYAAGEPIAGIHGAALHFGLILLLALYIATPGLKSLKRLRDVGICLAAMLAV